MPITTTPTEQERLLVNQICTDLLNDGSLGDVPRGYIAQVLAGEVTPTSLVEFMLYVSITHLDHLRTVTMSDRYREPIGRLPRGAMMLLQLAQDAGARATPQCPRCAQSIHVGVVCNDCNYAINDEREQRMREREEARRADQQRRAERRNRYGDDTPF